METSQKSYTQGMRGHCPVCGKEYLVTKKLTDSLFPGDTGDVLKGKVETLIKKHKDHDHSQ